MQNRLSPEQAQAQTDKNARAYITLESDGSPQTRLVTLFLQRIKRRGVVKGVNGFDTPKFMSLWTEDNSEITIHSIIEFPGRVILHATGKAKTLIGMEVNHEMVLITHIVTSDNGSLEVKRLDEFTNSRAYLDFFKVVEEAKINREHSASFAAWWWGMEPARSYDNEGDFVVCD